MFADAVEAATQFTGPVAISRRSFDNSVSTSIGAFVILNEGGWILTAVHIVELFGRLADSKNKLDAFEAERSKLENDTSLTPTQKKKRLKKLRPDHSWTRNFSFWWGRDGVEVVDVQGIPGVDLAVARLQPFDPGLVTTYPVIKDPTKNVRPGTSLCRLGFPFHSIQPTFDENRNAFVFPPGAVPPPFFPIEGILSRQILVAKNADYRLGFIETSSPGLKGQSGGPIFDSKGTVWGIQSQTRHYPLGFSPTLKIGSREIQENQFLNTGWGVHPETIVGVLKELKIAFQMSAY